MIKNYIVYSQSGKVLRSGQCSDISLKHQAEEGELVIEGTIDPEKQYIENGRAIDLPNKPGIYYTFNYATKQWQPDLSKAEMDVKFKRDTLLSESDFYDTVSAQQRLTPTVFNAWATYRQALRDITKQSGYPLTVAFPNPPNQS